MTTQKYIGKSIWYIGAAIFILLGAGFYLYTLYSPHYTEPLYTVPALTKEYNNNAYGFALKMPADFTPTEAQNADTDTIVLQDKQNNGVQIVVSPFDEDSQGAYTLTKERIQQDVPDMQITDEQPVEVGNNYKGLAFKSDNEAFSGASREVWFVFRGHLYQISTYERLDDLLQAVFATWQFL